MNGFIESISPDSFSGEIFALEGVAHALVVLNGPTGCKFYHSATSDSQTIRQLEFDPLNFPARWYFGQPRVPCTYLDNGDYVYGSEEKLVEALEFCRDNVPCELVAVVNSPGAALIGDDLGGIARRVLGEGVPLVVMETPGFSEDVCIGHENAAIALFEQLLDGSARKGRRRPLVNVLGLSLFHRNHTGDVAEIRRLLDLCGIDMGCFVCAGGSLTEHLAAGDADLNIVIHPEYGARTAAYLKNRFGTSAYTCDGPPIGFSATEQFIEDVCGMLGADPTSALEEGRVARARAYAFISRVHSLTGLPKGVPYAIEGTCSELYSYIGFLTRYFGMVPVAARVLCEKSNVFASRLGGLLEDLGAPGCLGVPFDETEPDLVFGSGNTISTLLLGNRRFSGIETMLPTLGYYDVIPKTHLGFSGALLLTELVLNGLMY